MASSKMAFVTVLVAASIVTPSCGSLLSDASAFIFGAKPSVIKVQASDFHALSAPAVDGTDFSFSNLQGKTTLVTNVASEWGFTKSNYIALVELYSKLKTRGLEIVAFPCNQFGGQEPGSLDEIRSVLDGYGVTFPVMDKVEVNGPGTHPVYHLLKGPEGHDIRWNFFSKFIVNCPDKECTVYRYDGAPNPSKLEEDILSLLGTRSSSGGDEL